MFDQKEFEKHFKTTSRLVTAIICFSIMGSIAILGFLFWVIYSFMNHFGVV